MADPLYEIARDVCLCKGCDRHYARSKAVPGEGEIGASIFLVGEAPGWREDATGKPFVHKSGRKLDEWLQRTGLNREDFYITNVLKCYGGKGVSFPEDDEKGGPVEACLPFLQREIEIVDPLAIIVTGRRALHHLILPGAIGRSHPFAPWAGRLCRRRDRFGERLIGVAWHPAKILRQWSPIDEENSLKVLRKIGAYVRARRAGKAAPLEDLFEIRPAGGAVYQQRMRLFGQEVLSPDDKDGK